jgi:hypothetical protein
MFRRYLREVSPSIIHLALWRFLFDVVSRFLPRPIVGSLYALTIHLDLLEAA